MIIFLTKVDDWIKYYTKKCKKIGYSGLVLLW